MSQFLRPDSLRLNIGSWSKDSGGKTGLNEPIDEANYNDADYTFTDAAVIDNRFEVGLSDPGETPGSGTQTIRWRATKIDGGRNIELTCKLLQGETVKAFQVQTLTDNDYTTYDFINSTEITDWTDLRLIFWVTNITGSGKAPDPAISWAEFEVPDAAGAGYYHGLKVQGIGELALCDVGTNPLRIRKGGTTYGIELVDTADGNASKLRIKTPSGIKAVRKYT